MSFQTFKIFRPEEAAPLTIPQLSRAVWAVRTDSAWRVEEVVAPPNVPASEVVFGPTHIQKERQSKSQHITQMIMDNVLQWTRGGSNYIHAEKDIAAIVDSELKKEEKATCRWTYDADMATYRTGCGDTWYFPEGTRTESTARFCPMCGKKIVGAK